MKCIILSAGYATRLYPLTENFPKPLLKVGEKAILDCLVDDIAPLTEEFVIVTNHRFFPLFRQWAAGKEQTITVLDDGTENNEARLGAVKDMQLAAEHIDGDCVVMAGDNILDFSIRYFVHFAQEKGTSCVMCHKETDPLKQQKTAIITIDGEQRITSYEEKPQQPKGDLAVPPFYFYKAADIRRIQDALDDGCGYDAPGSFAAWLSRQTDMHAYIMPGKRYDIGDMKSYQFVQETYQGIRQRS